MMMTMRETLVCIRKTATRYKPGGGETEVTVTSKLQANAERNKEIEKRLKREEKAASFGGAVRGSVPEDELSGDDVASAGARAGSRSLMMFGERDVGLY